MPNLTSYTISNSDIIKQGGTVTVTVSGPTQRIRSDYPVVLTFDGRSEVVLGLDSETFQPNPGTGQWIYKEAVKTITLRLATGFGAAGYAEAIGRYGVCVIEGDEYERLDPRLLSTHCYSFYEDTGVSQFGVVQADFGLSSWLINGKLPAEFYVTAVSVSQYDTTPSNLYYRLMNGTTEITLFRQANGGAGERQDLLSVAGVGAYTVPFPFHKLALASLLSPWGAETPQISIELHEQRTSHVQTQIHFAISGAVRW